MVPIKDMNGSVSNAINEYINHFVDHDDINVVTGCEEGEERQPICLLWAEQLCMNKQASFELLFNQTIAVYMLEGMNRRAKELSQFMWNA